MLFSAMVWPFVIANFQKEFPISGFMETGSRNCRMTEPLATLCVGLFDQPVGSCAEILNKPLPLI